MLAAARMEWAGIPVDLPLLHGLRDHWGELKGQPQRSPLMVNPVLRCRQIRHRANRTWLIEIKARSLPR